MDTDDHKSIKNILSLSISNTREYIFRISKGVEASQK